MKVIDSHILAGSFSDDTGVHEGKDAMISAWSRTLKFGDACEFGSFGFADGLGIVFFEEDFESGLAIFGKFEQVEAAYLLDLSRSRSGRMVEPWFGESL